MALSENINDLEKAKFVLNGKGKTRSRVESGLTVSNKLVAQKTEVGTSATKIVFPEQGSQFEIYHVTASTNVWLGNENDVEVSGENAIPLPPEMRIPIEIKEGEEPDFYGIAAADTVDVYVYGMIKE